MKKALSIISLSTCSLLDILSSAERENNSNAFLYLSPAAQLNFCAIFF
jgi:hypothetical protein